MKKSAKNPSAKVSGQDITLDAEMIHAVSRGAALGEYLLDVAKGRKPSDTNPIIKEIAEMGQVTVEVTDATHGEAILAALVARVAGGLLADALSSLRVAETPTSSDDE